MSIIRPCAAVLATLLTTVHASAFPRAVSCSSLTQAQLGSGIQVLSAVAIAAGDLAVPTYSGIGTIVNSFPLCQVNGTIKYAAGGNDTPDPNGADTLTWLLYLPAAADYNGRFMVVGKFVCQTQY